MSTENFRQHPRGWRSEAMHNAYADAIEAGEYADKTVCHLCEASSVTEFEHWRVIKNKFPYDMVAVQHDMIVPKVHKKEEDLTAAELQELRELKTTYINDNFQMIMESVPRNKSIPEHFHLHLLAIKTIS
jgi:diadenosine tetraphosphate (Ap4A) HIT family hydrolase